MSLKHKILAAQDIELKPIDVKEWGVTVWVKTMSLEESLEYWDNKEQDHTLSLLSYCLCDEAGNRLFTLEEVQQLKKKKWQIIQDLSEVAIEMNSRVKVEDAKKNSSETH